MAYRNPVEHELRSQEKMEAAVAKAGSVRELARQTGIPEKTLRDWRDKQESGHVWREGRWSRAVPEELPPRDLAREIRGYLTKCKTPRNIEQLCDHFDVAPKEVRGALEQLREDAVLLKVTEDVVSLEGDLQPTYEPRSIDLSKYLETEVPFGVTSDNHIGSTYERMDVLETAFDMWVQEGVEVVYQVGNIIDGEARGINERDIYVHGFEGQVDNLIQKWPRREGIKTFFITGNCHEGWYIKREHINVGLRIEQAARDAGREDLRFLGHQEYDLHFRQPGGEAKVRLVHPAGGSSYATSYKPQKIVESYQGGEKPNALLLGHFHKYDTGYPREVWELQCGCTQDQTPWMRGHNIAAHVGFNTVWMRQNELGLITSWTVRWHPFYDREFYTFNW